MVQKILLHQQNFKLYELEIILPMDRVNPIHLNSSSAIGIPLIFSRSEAQEKEGSITKPVAGMKIIGSFIN